jgi:hypothetical protein
MTSRRSPMAAARRVPAYRAVLPRFVALLGYFNLARFGIVRLSNRLDSIGSYRPTRDPSTSPNAHSTSGPFGGSTCRCSRSELGR